MNEPVTIDSEFQSLIPSLSDKESKQLEENCKKDGRILDTLKTWNGILIDGHNRYRISQKWGLSYRTEEIDLPDRNAVLLWIIDHQLGERNLPLYDKTVLEDKKRDILATQAKEKKLSTLKQNAVTEDKKSCPRKEQTRKEKRENSTDYKIAKAVGTSEDTVRKVRTIEQKAPEVVKQQIRSGEKSINQAYLEIKDKERKQMDLSARAHLREAEERHEDFQTAKTVSVDSIRQDKKDVAEIANAKGREVYNAIKGILFIGATADYSMLKNMDDSKAKQLAEQIDTAIETLKRIRKEIR